MQQELHEQLNSNLSINMTIQPSKRFQMNFKNPLKIYFKHFTWQPNRLESTSNLFQSLVWTVEVNKLVTYPVHRFQIYPISAVLRPLTVPGSLWNWTPLISHHQYGRWPVWPINTVCALNALCLFFFKLLTFKFFCSFSLNLCCYLVSLDE